MIKTLYKDSTCQVIKTSKLSEPFTIRSVYSIPDSLPRHPPKKSLQKTRGLLQWKPICYFVQSFRSMKKKMDDLALEAQKGGLKSTPKKQ